MTLTRAVIASLVLAAVVLFGQKHGLWGVREAPAPPPPTPAALAFRRAQEEAAARAEAARAEAARLAAVTQPAETPEVLPPGEGREEVFGACTACHSTAIIRRSRFTRQQWDDLMDWMVEKQGMNPLDAEQRRRIVDYLAAAFPAASGSAGRRAPNPFLTD
ncbi:hypothetical protein [Caldovatus aquaticus]|uniref:Cytochrome c domain-containing protein n=1 Tax=Caldovatus aquaticus TaxID=2865671 RepID=A0ABS7F3V1_9PROT|nr:hypothetical protein [Caldovatus aquaticus]MBW8270296.1 hypothetical protein [Caldovatus aquaticus]